MEIVQANDRTNRKKEGKYTEKKINKMSIGESKCVHRQLDALLPCLNSLSLNDRNGEFYLYAEHDVKVFELVFLFSWFFFFLFYQMLTTHSNSLLRCLFTLCAPIVSFDNWWTEKNNPEKKKTTQNSFHYLDGQFYFCVIYSLFRTSNKWHTTANPLPNAIFISNSNGLDHLIFG